MPPAPQEFGLCFLGFTGWVVTQDLGLTGSRGDKLCQHMVWGRQGLEETNCDKASSGPDGFLQLSCRFLQLSCGLLQLSFRFLQLSCRFLYFGSSAVLLGGPGGSLRALGCSLGAPWVLLGASRRFLGGLLWLLGAPWEGISYMLVLQFFCNKQ